MTRTNVQYPQTVWSNHQVWYPTWHICIVFIFRGHSGGQRLEARWCQLEVGWCLQIAEVTQSIKFDTQPNLFTSLLPLEVTHVVIGGHWVNRRGHIRHAHVLFISPILWEIIRIWAHTSHREPYDRGWFASHSISLFTRSNGSFSLLSHYSRYPMRDLINYFA